jgi:hypothetical protein
MLSIYSGTNTLRNKYFFNNYNNTNAVSNVFFILSFLCVFACCLLFVYFFTFLCCLCNWPYAFCASTLIIKNYYYYYYYYYYYRVIKSTRITRERHVVRIKERKCADRAFVGKREWRRPLGRLRRRRENNIKMDLRKVGWGVDWTDPAQDRDRWRAVVNAVMNLRVPQNTESFLTSWGLFSFSVRTLVLGVRYH